MYYNLHTHQGCLESHFHSASPTSRFNTTSLHPHCHLFITTTLHPFTFVHFSLLFSFWAWAWARGWAERDISLIRRDELQPSPSPLSSSLSLHSTSIPFCYFIPIPLTLSLQPSLSITLHSLSVTNNTSVHANTSSPSSNRQSFSHCHHCSRCYRPSRFRLLQHQKSIRAFHWCGTLLPSDAAAIVTPTDGPSDGPADGRAVHKQTDERCTSRQTSGAQAGRRAVHKQADERRISDASAMHEGQSNSQTDARCTSDRWMSDAPADGPAMDQLKDQRWTSDAGATSRADGRTMHEGQRNRGTRDAPAMDQRCTSDRATPRPTMDEQATDHDSSRPVRDEQWTTGRRDCSTTTASRGLSRLLPTATAMLAVHALQARFTRRRRRCTPTNCTEIKEL